MLTQQSPIRKRKTPEEQKHPDESAHRQQDKKAALGVQDDPSSLQATHNSEQHRQTQSSALVQNTTTEPSAQIEPAEQVRLDVEDRRLVRTYSEGTYPIEPLPPGFPRPPPLRSIYTECACTDLCRRSTSFPCGKGW